METKNFIHFDNGGAEAIKGFNFQKANLILLAINNYNKPAFKIYIEAEDDIVITVNQYQAFIQVKKQSLTFNALSKKDVRTYVDENGEKKKKIFPSILEKNLSAGVLGDSYKIIVKDIGRTDKKKLNLKKPGVVCSELLELNNGAKQDLENELPEELKAKLDNFYIYISPIHENLNEAIKYLIGSLNSVGISVDDNKGRATIAELCLTVDQKAEEIITVNQQKEMKSIEQEYLVNIFDTCDSLSEFDTVLDSLEYNKLLKNQIKKERLKIELTKTELKKEIHLQMENYLVSTDLFSISNSDIIKHFVDLNSERETIKTSLIALIIEVLAEREV